MRLAEKLDWKGLKCRCWGLTLGVDCFQYEVSASKFLQVEN
jgi:hypothetical protein